MDLFGSNFPASTLCAAVGVVAAVIIGQILAVAGINDYVVTRRQFIPVSARVDWRSNHAGG